MQSLRRESGLVCAAMQYVSWGLTRSYLSLCHRLSIYGRENLPRSPHYVLVANHCSHLDAVSMASAVPWRHRDRVFPIAAGDLFFETPARAFISALGLNALPMWRQHCGRHALGDLRARLLEEDCIYVLFPEGSRSRDGRMARFKPGLGMLVAGTDVPVVPCHLAGTFNALPPHRRMPKMDKVTLKIGEPICFANVANARPGWEEVGKTLRESVADLGRASHCAREAAPAPY